MVDRWPGVEDCCQSPSSACTLRIVTEVRLILLTKAASDNHPAVTMSLKLLWHNISGAEHTDMFGCGAVVLFTMTKTTQFQAVRGVLERSVEKGEERLVLVYGEAKTRIIWGRELDSLLVTNWLPARAGAMRSQRSEEGWVRAGCGEGKGKKSESRWRWTSENMGLTIVEVRLAVGRNTSEERSSHIRWFKSIQHIWHVTTCGWNNTRHQTSSAQLLKSPSWWSLMFCRGARDPADHSPALLFCKSESDS